MTALWVGIGGFFGAAGRYGLALWLGGSAGSFPAATLITNLLGCLLIGLFTALLPGDGPWRAALIIGLLGGFTTFSTFGLETLDLLARDAIWTALIYVSVSVLAGVLAVWLGLRLGGLTPGTL